MKAKNKAVKAAIEEVFAAYRFHHFVKRTNLPAVPDVADYCETIESIVGNLDPDEQLLIRERYMKRARISDMQVYSFKFDPPTTAVTYGKIRKRAFDKLLYAFEQLGLLTKEERTCQ